MFRTFAIGAFCLCFICFVNGCGYKMPRHLQTFKVSGKVTLDGKPVVGNEVRFVPVTAGRNGLDARSFIAEDGTYSASSYVDQEGMVPGEYKVYVEPFAILPGKPSITPTTIPEKYRSQESTDLKFTVKSEDNRFDIALN